MAGSSFAFNGSN